MGTKGGPQGRLPKGCTGPLSKQQHLGTQGHGPHSMCSRWAPALSTALQSNTPFPKPLRTHGGQPHQCLCSFGALGAQFLLSASPSTSCLQGLWMLIDPGLSLFGGRYRAASSVILLFWILLFLAGFMKRGPKPLRGRLGSVRTWSWGWFWCPW